MAHTLAVLLALLLAATLGVTILSMALFWRQSRRDGHWAELARGFGSPWPPVLRASLTGWASLALSVLLYPLRLIPARDKAASSTASSTASPIASSAASSAASPDTDPSPSVILVHGLFHNASAWLLYRPILARAGLRHQYLLEYNSLTAIFPEAEARLAALVERAAAERPGRGVVVIGHSLGGLLARATAARPELAPYLAGIVTLASPHRGSLLARLGITRLARSLHPDSALMRALDHHLPPAGMPKLAVRIPTDGLVLPNASAVPPGEGWTLAQTPPMGHIDVLYHPATARLAARFALEAGRGKGGADPCPPR
jgi:pimeloyl-ACP methyl ester carboxylesterase